jgi:hypothetical protein
MSEPGDPRRTWRWQAFSRRVRATAAALQLPCSRCGEAIDYTLPSNSRWGATVDHTVALAFAGEPYPNPEDVTVMHRHCNSKAGSQIGHLRRWGKPTTNTPNIPSNPMHNTHPMHTMHSPTSTSSSTTPQITPMPGRVFTPKLVIVPTSYAGLCIEPRLMSESHSDAVGSLAGEWCVWLDREFGFTPRPWQRMVLDRALEVDASGKFVWRNVVVSTSRQSGKSWLIKALAVARAAHADKFGEPQECLHVANNLMASRRILMSAGRWAMDSGLELRRAQGQERVVWPDGSHWSLSSESAIYGNSASLGICDECWDISLEVVESALVPTLVERVQPQLWLFSTAHVDATALMPSYRKAALDGDPRTMIVEWSAAPGSDIHDPAVWQAASAHWTEQRGELMAAAQNTPSFAQQWLNQWPNDSGTDAGVWLPGWDALPQAVWDASLPVLAAVEVAADRSCAGAAVAQRMDSGRVNVLSRVFRDVVEAVEWITGFDPLVVMAGVSIRDQVLGAWTTQPAGLKETRYSTPWLADAVLRGAVHHDHDADTRVQFRGAKATETEFGMVLSAKKSDGPIPAPKAVAWAAIGISEDWYGIRNAPEIW